MPNKRVSIQVHTCACRRAILINREQWANMDQQVVIVRTCPCKIKWEMLVTRTFQKANHMEEANYIIYRIDAMKG